MSLSWKPKRRGNKYCSPACGAGCTFEDYQSAMKAAKDTVAMMKSGKWKPRVHENMGWYAGIVSERKHIWISIDIYETGGNRYSTSYSPEGTCPATPMEYALHGKTFRDPNKAVKAQMDKVATVMRKEMAGWTRARNDAGF